MPKKKILVVGSGAREHALAWKLLQSPSVGEIVVAPGNAGIAGIARCVPVSVDDVPGLVALARSEAIDLVVVGPEAPLVSGLVDALEAAGIAAFGPRREAARLEGSKAFAKEIMREAGVPTAGFAVFDDAEAAEAYVREAGRPLVVKADGLCAGKGVVVAKDTAEALEAVRAMMRERVHGDAGARVVIEECLVGPEVSYHVVCDGTRYVPLAAAQDHKRLLDGDRGPNTGGMGAYSPPPVVTPEIERAILSRVVEPVLETMRARGTPFRGALFVGVMVVDGAPQVLEFNVRFGDPETEVLMARWGGDVLPLFDAAARGDLGGIAPAWDAPHALAVVLAAHGYPTAPRKGDRIEGLEAVREVPGVVAFHAGTRASGGGLETAGGRVLTVTAIGASLEEAAERAYLACDRIRFDGMQLRRDIGWQARRS
ncbi:MAG: phosphoribosylamine--glycine ligase [Sandaracinaceae bacterium]|jgi:phosphoribosylamine--glycine ligase|nr:phosphoribosylamine--glycine ligase [Sandaracinaceae bacterium]